jgi:putative transposase
MGHLKRLERVFSEIPVFFITTCTHGRKPVLAQSGVVDILRDEWRSALNRYGWKVGSFVVMPDHLHFFCLATGKAKPLKDFMCHWKEWTAKRVAREWGLEIPLWQAEFFDHVLRKEEFYVKKAEYMRLNPVRAGLVENPEDWPWQGEIYDLKQSSFL